ncbi:MAG TPA: SpoIIE family protein phosphatase [Jatrophihabitans sp.]
MTTTHAEHQAAISLARVLTDRPSAVLLIDLAERQVVYANPLAVQLAPSIHLPVDVSDWSHHAGLRDDTGAELETGPAPLQKVAAGEPVNGEVVTALRGSDIAEAREDLWVVGMPLDGAPGALGNRALVVFLPLREQPAVEKVQLTAVDLRHQAVVASSMAFSISDPKQKDNPLVWVNPAFERVTGYSVDAALGRNCRFLQGPLTDPAAIRRMSEALHSSGIVNETLLNYRADGTAFWNHVVVSPVFDADGTLTHHVAVQTDVTERVDADIAREAALRLAEAAQHRERALAAISAALAVYPANPADLLAALPGLVVAHFWGWCAVLTLDAAGQVADSAVAYGAPPGQHDAAAVGGGADTAAYAVGARDTDLAKTVLAAVLAGPGKPIVEAAAGNGTWPVRLTLTADEYEQLSDRPLVPGIADERAGRSMIAAPLMSRGRASAVLLVSRPDESAFSDPAEVAAIVDLALRAGTALDNARLYAAEHEAALTLQRSLLPKVPHLADFDVSAAYIPAQASEVGGDWFDVLDLPGPWLGVAIGDVMGHDMNAVAAMGQVRSMTRALAWDGRRPAQVVDELDGLVRGLGATTMVTCFYAVLDEPSDASAPAPMSYTSAGHLPALLRHEDGRIERLDAALTPPIGVAADRSEVEGHVDVPPGAALVLYTDGLVERRHSDLDEGISALTRVLARTGRADSAETIKDAILAALVTDDRNDDICVLVITRP